MRRYHWVHLSHYQFMLFQFPDLLYQHFLRYRRYSPAQVTIALGPTHEVKEDDRLPPSTDLVKRKGDRAFAQFSFFVDLVGRGLFD